MFDTVWKNASNVNERSQVHNIIKPGVMTCAERIIAFIVLAPLFQLLFGQLHVLHGSEVPSEGHLGSSRTILSRWFLQPMNVFRKIENWEHFFHFTVERLLGTHYV